MWGLREKRRREGDRQMGETNWEVGESVKETDKEGVREEEEEEEEEERN